MMKSAIFLSLYFLTGMGALADDAETRYQASVERAYEEVLADVEFAITEHNFRVTDGNRIGEAIRERGHPSFQRSQIVHFCNLEYARRFLEAAPDYLLHMPCKIVVYERDGRVVVETRLLPEDDSRVQTLSREVNQMLRDIVDYATVE